jgi:hypothetical protein
MVSSGMLRRVVLVRTITEDTILHNHRRKTSNLTPFLIVTAVKTSNLTQFLIVTAVKT